MSVTSLDRRPPPKIFETLCGKPSMGGKGRRLADGVGDDSLSSLDPQSRRNDGYSFTGCGAHVDYKMGSFSGAGYRRTRCYVSFFGA